MQMPDLESGSAKNVLRAKEAEVPLGLGLRGSFSLGRCLLVCMCVCDLTTAIKRLRKLGRKQPCLPLGQGSCFVLWARSCTNKASSLAAQDGQTSPPA